MKLYPTFRVVVLAKLLLAILAHQSSPLFAQSTTITYGGELLNAGFKADGLYDVRVGVYDAATGGNLIGDLKTNTLDVVDGKFTAKMDFGDSVFTGGDRWLEVGVRPAGVGDFNTLSPRQEITSIPHAIKARAAISVTGPVQANQLTGLISPYNIGAGSISEAMLASNSVGTERLADRAVTAEKIATITTTALFSTTIITNPTPAPGDFFGRAVAVVGTDKVIIGSRWSDTMAPDAGAAYLFSIKGKLLTTFIMPSPATHDAFGTAVAAVGADHVLIGAYGDDTGELDAGVAYLFHTNGILVTTFTNPTPQFHGWFGLSVAAVGEDKVLIGASGHNDLAGAAYLFSTNGTLLTTFTTPTDPYYDQFGSAVAAVGTDKVLIGAPTASIGLGASGAAYLFSTTGNLLTTITNPTPAHNDQFGYSVAAVGEDKVIIGKIDDTLEIDAGAAYLFSTDGTLLTTFTRPTSEASDMFGTTVAAVGSDRVLIGSASDDTGASNAGAAYLFDINGTLLTTITNPSPASDDSFGLPVVAAGSDRVLIGAAGDDTGAPSAGVVYVISLESYARGLVAEGVREGAVNSSSIAEKAVTATKLADDAVTSLKILDGTVAVSDLHFSLLNETFWRLDGNDNTTVGTHFLGTTDAQPLEFRVNNQPAFRITYGTNINGFQSVNIVAGDTNNFLGTNVHGNFIAGGGSNWIGANSGYNVIGGGAGNTIPTNASFATIPGGVENSATEWSFAAGVRARANHRGSFVWNGTKTQILETTADHQFLIGALGGVGIGTNNPQAQLHVRGTVLADAFVGDGSGLSNVTATATITNPIPDFLLPATVARLNTNQTFTASNTFSGVMVATNEANQFGGQFNGIVSGDGAGLTAVDAASLGGLGAAYFWHLGGNAGSTAGTHFLGTTDNQPLELRANDHRVVRLAPASAYYGAGSLEVGYDNAPNIVAGAAVNQVDPGVVGATIGGGGAESYWTSFTPGVPISNHISQYFGTIGGGGDNKIIGDNSTALDPFYKVGSTIGGGWGNVSGGSFATVPGGKFNEARGNLSFAAGHRAKATNEGAFVWADSQDANFSSTANNQFLIRASGGVGIGTNNPQAQLHVRGTVIADAFVGDGSGLSNVTITDGQLPATLARLNTNQVFTSSNTFAGVMVATNGANQFRGQFNGIVSGNGAGLTNLAIGSLAGVAFLGTNQTFTASNTFTGVLIATNGANQINGLISGNGAGLSNVTASTFSGNISDPQLSANIPRLSGNASFNGTLTATNFVGHGAGLTNLNASQLTSGTVPAAALSNAWKLGGNAGTTAGTQFVGTTDNQALELKVNNARAMRLEPNATSPNVLGGFAGNTIGGGISGSVIAGGGQLNNTNRVTASFGAVGGGYNNLASGGSAVVAGGDNNTASQARSTVSGGFSNRATGLLSAVGGGDINLAGGQAATVPGGSLNDATADFSFAAGRRAKATNQGAFVWADSQNANFNSTANNQFLIRAAGGVGIGTNAPVSALHVHGIVTALGFNGPLNPTNIGAGIVSSPVSFTNLGNAFAGDGTGLTNVNAGTLDGLDSSVFWKLGGNNITSPTAQFLGSTNNQPMEVRVSNSRVLRLEPTGISPNLIAGYHGNLVGSNAVGAAISGGGRSESTNRIFANYGVIGGGRGNTVNGLEATIGGGYGNLANTTAVVVGGGWLNSAMGAASSIGGGYLNTALGTGSTIGGGQFNSTSNLFTTVGGGATNYALGSFATIAGGTVNLASGIYSTIGGGLANYAQNQFATVGGGDQNVATGDFTTIAGGFDNEASGLGASVGGGYSNTATTNQAVVAGGYDNTASGVFSAVGGGLQNMATNDTATVPGGYLNLAGGDGSFAAGVNAKAIHSSTFVWSDYGFPFTSSGPNQFLIRASGGVAINTNDPAGASLRVNGGIRARGGSPGGFGGNNNGYAFAGNGGDADSGMFSSADGQLEFFSNDQERMRIDPDGKVGIGRVATANRLEVEGDASKSVAGSWLANSDARIKRDVQPVAGALDRLARVQLVSFRYTEDYRAQHPAVEDRRYLNVLAQQFRDVFPEHVKASGERLADGSEILQVDTYPLTIYSAAAVQELNQKLNQKETEITELKQRLEKLEQLLNHKLNGGAK